MLILKSSEEFKKRKQNLVFSKIQKENGIRILNSQNLQRWTFRVSCLHF